MDKRFIDKLEIADASPSYLTYRSTRISLHPRLKIDKKVMEINISIYGATAERFAAITQKPKRLYDKLCS
jgi:hypothetical protein